jgi:hypothetical protein
MLEHTGFISSLQRQITSPLQGQYNFWGVNVKFRDAALDFAVWHKNAK